ncbi:hypothetical protein ACIGFK_04110 [Streptomyces sp. NPDC085524]|uniref:hypothetical protein n=1 Tax=Streptomyces sp. NPDC085524 TaxID=3365728 RepID=UPI0037D9494B
MLDTYDIAYDAEGNHDVMMCHSTFQCHETFRGGLIRIVDFLKAHPDEVVTVFLENHASRATLTEGVSDVLEGTGSRTAPRPRGPSAKCSAVTSTGS